MAPYSSTLAWKIPWTEEPGRLQSMGSLGVGHDWATSLWLFTFLHWRRKRQPTPAFLPGESQGRGSLVGCRLWGHTELDTTERLNWTELRCDSDNIILPPCTGGTQNRIGWSQSLACTLLNDTFIPGNVKGESSLILISNLYHFN